MVPIVNQGSPTAFRKGAVYLLIKVGERWKLQNRFSGEYFTPKGRYNFVRMISGAYRVSKRGEHVQLSSANPVAYAGEVRFGYNTANRGQLREWSNASGHYVPRSDLAHQAQLPMELFRPIL